MFSSVTHLYAFAALAPGGEALKYAASVRLEVRSPASGKISKSGEVVGIRQKASTATAGMERIVALAGWVDVVSGIRVRRHRDVDMSPAAKTLQQNGNSGIQV